MFVLKIIQNTFTMTPAQGKTIQRQIFLSSLFKDILNSSQKTRITVQVFLIYFKATNFAHASQFTPIRVWITWWSATDARVIFLFWIACHLSSEEGLWLQQVTLSKGFQTWWCPDFCSWPLLRGSGFVRAPPSLSEEQDCSSTQWNLWKNDMGGASRNWLLLLFSIAFLSFSFMIFILAKCSRSTAESWVLNCNTRSMQNMTLIGN